MPKKSNRKSDLFLAKLSRLAYERPMTFVRHLYLLKYSVPLFNLAFSSENSVTKTKLKYPESDIKEVFYLRTKNFVYGYFIIINKILYIVFRGTRSILNIISFVNYNISDSGFHEGYIKSFERNIESSFFTYIDKIKDRFKRIVLTGHSAGAVYSTIAAYKLAHQGYKPEIVGFGCPRFCTKEVMTDLKKKVKLRYYVNDGDIIPKLPLGNYADPPIYKKMKCGYILNTIHNYSRCHREYLDVIFDKISLHGIMHKIFIYKEDKTKHKTIKLRMG